MFSEEEAEAIERECPICEFNYVHLDKIMFIPDSDAHGGIPITLSTKRGSGETQITVGDAPVSAGGRGWGIVTYLHCENHHAWLEVQYFHKGQVWVSWERDPEREAQRLEALAEEDEEEEDDLHRQARSFVKRLQDRPPLQDLQGWAADPLAPRKEGWSDD